MAGLRVNAHFCINLVYFLHSGLQQNQSYSLYIFIPLPYQTKHDEDRDNGTSSSLHYLLRMQQRTLPPASNSPYP
jgi:hypothetical protein